MSLAISADSAGFVVTFRYNPALVAAVKALPGRRFNPTTKAWLVPASASSAVAAFARRHRAEVDASAAKLLDGKLEDAAPSFPPTAEQAAVIAAAESGSDLKVEAYAGAGKTTTLVHVAHALAKRGKRGAYLAFNAAIAAEASEKFPRSVECRTTHSFANRITGAFRLYEKKLRSKLYPRDIRRLLDLPDMHLGKEWLQLVFAIQSAVRNFCNSADQQLGPQHVAAKDLSHYDVPPLDAIDPAQVMAGLQKQKAQFIAFVVERAQQLWALQIDKNREDVAMSHDHYLKLWHLSGLTLNVDYLLIDEAQDLNPVTLAIIAAHKCQIIWVGDRHQQIYSWRGSVNAMEKIEAPCAYVTQSFRWGPEVAEVANAILALKGDLPHPVRGFVEKPTVLGFVSDEYRHTKIFRGNAALFAAALDAVEADRSICVVGSLDEPIAMMETAYHLRRGSLASLEPKKQHPDIRGFASWDELLAAAQDDKALEQVAARVEKYGDELPGLIAKLRAAGEVEEDEADIILTTAHKAKGREWPVVVLGYDYCSHLNYIRQGEDLRIEEINILYVAATRATKRLELNRAAEELLDPEAVAAAFEQGRAA